MRLCDKSFSGIATGVGSAPILGRVHCAIMKLGKSFYQCSFTIIGDPQIRLDSHLTTDKNFSGQPFVGVHEFILGLDQLRRHQVCNPVFLFICLFICLWLYFYPGGYMLGTQPPVNPVFYFSCCFC